MKIPDFIFNNKLLSDDSIAVIKKSLTYILSDVINKILPFLLLPILTRYLSPSDFGTLSVFESIVGFLAVFVGLGSQEMVKVNYFRKDNSYLANYIGNVFILTLLTSLLFILIFQIFKDFFLDAYGLKFKWLFIAIAITFGSFFNKIISIIWIAEGNSLPFAKFQNLSSLTTVLSTIIFVVVLEMNWQGRVYSLLFSVLVFSSIAFYIIIKKEYLDFNFNPNILWTCVKESVGVLPYSVSFWFKNAALLLLMAALIGKSETGIYASAMKIAVIVNLAVVSLNKVWQPMLFKMLSNEATKPLKIVKRIYLYLALILFIGLAMILLSEIIVKVALAPEFHSATIYVRYLVVAIAVQSMFTAMADFLMFHKETKRLTIVSISGIILQYGIIYLFYLFGALDVMKIIYAIIIAGVFTLIVSWIMTLKVRPLPWLFFIKFK